MNDRINDVGQQPSVPMEQPGIEQPEGQEGPPPPGPGMGGDQGGDMQAQGPPPPGAPGTPPLQDPDGGLSAQSYTDAADNTQNLSINDALIELMQASIKDKHSERDLYTQDTEMSYKESMDAVAKEFKANKDKETAAIVSAAVDMGANAINMGMTLGSISAGGSDAEMMGRNQAIGAGTGAMSDIGNIIGSVYTRKSDDENTEAEGMKAEAAKKDSLAKGDDDVANVTQSVIDLASQAFKQKADAELEAARGARTA